jgi:hypothetical protein
VEFGQQFSRRGAALMSIPIDLRPPATGETFTIPATFLRPEPFAGSRGVSSLFDARTGKWLTEVTKPTETELLFRLPEATEGMRLERAEVRIKVNAPYREVRLVTERAGTRHTVFRRKSPSGLLTFSIAGDQLEVHPAGGLWMMVKVTPSDRAVELPEPPQRYPDAAEGQAGGSQPSAAEPGAAGEDAAEQGAAGLAPPGIQPRTAPRVIDNTTWQIDSIDVDVTGLIPASAAGDR